jgi:hypothetical protein
VSPRAVFADVESPVSPEFLTCCPTPGAAAHPGEKRMAAFCVKHGYSGRRAVARPAGSGQVSAAWALARTGRCPASLRASRRLPPAPAARPSGRPPASTALCTSAGPATKRFRVAITTFADNSRRASPRAARICNDARATGKDHPAPSAPWPAPGSASSGDAGSKAPLRHRPARSRRRPRHAAIQANRRLRLTWGVSCGVPRVPVDGALAGYVEWRIN